MKKTKKKEKAALKLNGVQQRLVEENIPFAMNLGKSYAAVGRLKGVPVEDLQQEACIGLCAAAKKYDARQGVKFSTYAFLWCKKYILKAISDETLKCEYDTEVADTVEDEDDTMLAEQRKTKVEAMMSVLDRHEKKVICLMFGFEGEEKTMKEVASKMRLQQTRVRQIYNKALNKLEMYGNC